MTEFFERHLGPTQTIAIFRGLPPQDTVRSCRRAWGDGIDLVEVPVQGAGAFRSLAAALEASSESGRFVGAGSLRTPEDIDRVIGMGARFGVSAGVGPELLAHARARGFPLLPGVATATEIMLAISHGSSWMKMFPASVLGPAWASAQLAVFPGIRLVATGGVTERNAPEFLGAGCSGFATSAAPGVA